jgi:hypothetical protein
MEIRNNKEPAALITLLNNLCRFGKRFLPLSLFLLYGTILNEYLEYFLRRVRGLSRPYGRNREPCNSLKRSCGQISGIRSRKVGKRCEALVPFIAAHVG